MDRFDGVLEGDKMDFSPFVGRYVKVVIEIGDKVYFYSGRFNQDGTFVDKFGTLFSFSVDTIKRIEVAENG